MLSATRSVERPRASRGWNTAFELAFSRALFNQFAKPDAHFILDAKLFAEARYSRNYVYTFFRTLANRLE